VLVGCSQPTCAAQPTTYAPAAEWWVTPYKSAAGRLVRL